MRTDEIEYFIQVRIYKYDEPKPDDDNHIAWHGELMPRSDFLQKVSLPTDADDDMTLNRLIRRAEQLRAQLIDRGYFGNVQYTIDGRIRGTKGWTRMYELTVDANSVAR